MLYVLVTAANRSGPQECVTSLPSWSCGFDSRRPLSTTLVSKSVTGIVLAWHFRPDRKDRYARRMHENAAASVSPRRVQRQPRSRAAPQVSVRCWTTPEVTEDLEQWVEPARSHLTHAQNRLDPKADARLPAHANGVCTLKATCCIRAATERATRRPEPDDTPAACAAAHDGCYPLRVGRERR